jgi:hypothetical protein
MEKKVPIIILFCHGIRDKHKDEREGIYFEKKGEA